MEDASSQVELVLSSDTDEAAEGKGNRDHLHHDSNHKCYAFQKLGHTPKILCSVAAAVFLILIGFLIGYLVHQNKDFPSEVAVVAVNETGVASLDWEDVKKLLAQKLTPFSAETVLSEFTDDSHQAGSSGDEDLGNKVLKRFKEYGMNIWTENYFVKIQDPPVSGYNRIIFGGQEERTTGFLSYSASGTAKGAVLYANYGQEEDFRQLNTMKINMSGRVMLVRAGRISFAEKVANAAKMNASAVLIYPDPTDYSIGNNTSVFGHVHLGSGDPYTPGLPALNHTQFPPAQSSGLPNILAQTITTAVGIKILRQLGGVSTPSGWRAYSKLGDESNMITVEVNNVLTTKKIINVFGVIKGFVDADRYVVIGAQRDAWGPGFAASTVGTSVLVELARSISDMVKNGGFKLRRSIVFASWSAGEYGSVGATEWLEGYFSSLSIKAVAYINLDGIVTGRNGFKVAASPLLYSLIENALSEVMYNKGQSLSSRFGKNNWVANVMEPLRLDSAAYPFLAFSGIPSVAFRFHSDHTDYQYFGTMLDTRENLNQVTANQVPQLAVIAGQFAGHIALRLVHDHLLEMNPKKYDQVIRNHVVQINSLVKDVWRMQPQLLPKDLKVQWLHLHWPIIISFVYGLSLCQFI